MDFKLPVRHTVQCCDGLYWNCEWPFHSTQQPLVLATANDGFEPSAEVPISRCARSQHKRLPQALG
jgi:hypothetical protein